MQGMGLLRRKEEVHLCGILFWLFHKGWVPGFSFWGQSPNHFIPCSVMAHSTRTPVYARRVGHKSLAKHNQSTLRA